MRQIFTEKVRFQAPDGFLNAVSATARRQHMTSSEFLRRAVIDRMQECGVALGAASSANIPPCLDRRETDTPRSEIERLNQGR